MIVVGDCETNGLMPGTDTMHCAVFIDLESDQTWEFTPKNIHRVKDFLRDVDGVIFHNWYGFDNRVFKKLLGINFDKWVRDTLLMSRLLFPDMAKPIYYDDTGKLKTVKYAHSIEAYGVRFGLKKPEYEDWSRFTPDMLNRCRVDAQIGKQTYLYLVDCIKKMQAIDPRLTKFEEVIELEQKVAEIISRQEENAWQFDHQYAFNLVFDLDDQSKKIEDELIPKLPMHIERPYSVVCKCYKKDGEFTKTTSQWLESQRVQLLKTCKYELKPTDVCGDFSRFKIETMNIGSEKQLKTYLLENGWKPSVWNVKKDKYNKPIRDDRGRHIKTSPKLPENAEGWQEVADLLDNENIKMIAGYNKINHRKSQIRGLIDNMRSDYRVECQANTCGSNTRRMYHRIIVNIPKADDDVFLGKEMRSLFIAAPGKVLVGCDAHALEARIEAHYIYPFDPENAKETIEGDIHSKNAKAWECDRKTAKSGKYALVYGCSAPKLAATLNKPKDIAQDLYDAFWDTNPGLKELKDRVEYAYSKYGYVLSIDGVPLSIRYEHAIINTVFQSAGAICMKKANILLDNYIICAKLKSIQIGHHHDEFTEECLPEEAEQTGLIIVKSMKEAGEYYKLNVPLGGEYKIGKNWAEIH